MKPGAAFVVGSLVGLALGVGFVGIVLPRLAAWVEART